MTVEYNKEKWLKICKTTLSNYINMEKRLSDSKKLSDFILVYYSIFLIINSLTSVYFDSYNAKVCEYFGIILSIVMLAYSLINSNANYSRRIETVTAAINSLKRLKRDNLINENLDFFKEEYNRIVDNVEFRSDLDFFKTVKAQCKEHGVKWFLPFDTSCNQDREQLKNYLSEISPYFLQAKLCFLWCFKTLVLIFPVAVFLICFIIV